MGGGEERKGLENLRGHRTGNWTWEGFQDTGSSVQKAERYLFKAMPRPGFQPTSFTFLNRQGPL